MAENYDNMISRLDEGNLMPWSTQNEAAILEPYNYIVSVPGKDIRSKLIEAFNLWLDVPPKKLEVIRNIITMLHSASLMVDDVEDASLMRRGVPVVHKVYGVPQTINSANYVYFLALHEIRKLSEEDNTSGVRLDQIATDELLNLHRGQGLELVWRDSLTCPTEEEYMSMVNNKTGGLFRLFLKLMMSQSSSTIDYTPLVNLIGVLFQIRDDYMNLQSKEYATNKSFAEDLTEGKFSFPIVHAIRAEPGRQVLNVLQKRPTTPTLKRYIINYMDKETNSFEYTKKVMDNLDRQAREEIERLGGNALLIAMLDFLKVP